MHRTSTDAEYLDNGKLVINADGIPFEPASKDDVGAAEQSLGQRINNEKWSRGRLNPATMPDLGDANEGFGYIATAADAAAYGMPEDTRGIVIIQTYNTGGWGVIYQTAMVYAQYQARISVRVKSGSGWFDWQRVDANSLRAELDTKTSANLGSAPSLGLSTLDDAPEGFITVDTITQATNYGLPDYLNMPAVIHTLQAGPTKIQTAWGYSAMQGRVAVRYSNGTKWYDWSRTDASWVQAELDNKADSDHTHPELEQLVTSATAGGAGTKIVPLALTAPGGSNSALTQDAGAVRIIRSWAHNPYRVRVHISNKNPANRTFRDNIGASLQLISAQEDGTIEGTTSLGYVTIPGEGEWVSGWVDVPNPESDWVGINAAWSGQTGKTQQLLQGGGWTKTTNDGWTDMQTTGWEWVTQAPFYVWFEAEAPANAPVIMVNGDSISIGTATSNPVQDSWVAIHARERGALPILMSQHGSGMSWWGANSTRWDDMYPGVDVKPDAIITALGQNDLTTRDLEWQKTYYAELSGVYGTRWPGIPVYAASITPSNKTPDLEVQRRDFNTWVKAAPHGERGYLDVAAPIATADDEDIKPEYAADHVHPNTAGMQVMATVLNRRPITGYAPSQAAV